MLAVITSALIGIIEKEVISHAPEIEAMIITELERLGTVIMDYVNSKEGVTKAATPAE